MGILGNWVAKICFFSKMLSLCCFSNQWVALPRQIDWLYYINILNGLIAPVPTRILFTPNSERYFAVSFADRYLYTFSKNDVISKTLLCFRVRVRARAKVRVRGGGSGNSFRSNVFSSKWSRSLQISWQCALYFGNIFSTEIH